MSDSLDRTFILCRLPDDRVELQSKFESEYTFDWDREIGLAQAYQIDVDDAVVDADDFMAVGSIDRAIDTQTQSV